MRIIEIPKGTGTYADSLRAIGTASLLEEISGAETIIRDMGTHFQVECTENISDEELKPPSPGFYYIWLKSKEKERPKGLVLDYEEEKKRVDAMKKDTAKKKKESLNKALEEQGSTAIEKVHSEYKPAAILASMRKGWSSDKDIYIWITKNPDKALQWARNELLAEQPVKPPLKVSNSQFYNPVSGKGVHAAKTIAKSPGAITQEVVEPFDEWMKYRGAYHSMLPYRNGDDFKLIVIEPREIGPKALSILRKKLMGLNLWGGIRLDIEVSLRLAEELIMHSDVMGQTVSLRGKRPSEVISGLRQAFFKSLGTAAALMNDSFLPLPNWFRIENRDDANAFLEIIAEHRNCLNPLYEKPPKKPNPYSGDVPILQQYRKWLTTGDLSDVLDFLSRFAIHVMEKRGRNENEWVKEFSTKNLTILFERGYALKEIVENQGFLSVAWAVRNATITALWLQQQKKKKWDVRFGLAQKWKQKIKGGSKEFIPVLAEFIQDYNWEVTNRLEGKYHTVSKEDLDQVISLISDDEKDQSELVGMLLLAYGYARVPKEEIEKLNSTSKEESR